jgi:hypothetical protein
MLLETHEDQLPAPREPFLIVDLYLRVQGLSRRAESLLRVREDIVVGRPVTELLVAADAENSGSSGLVNAICAAASGEQPGRQPAVSVRPSNMHGVRMRARVTHCGPPLAALLVLESPDGPQIRLVEQ